MASLTPQILQTLRQYGGVVSAAELQAAQGVSQPTGSRALAPLASGAVRAWATWSAKPLMRFCSYRPRSAS